jgi:hypothetical protein
MTYRAQVSDGGLCPRALVHVTVLRLLLLVRVALAPLYHIPGHDNPSHTRRRQAYVMILDGALTANM